MKIFLDVGGFQGDSIAAALDPVFGFERVFCFEPVASMAGKIRDRYRDPRLVVIAGGLSDNTLSLNIYGAGSLGSTVFPDGPDANLAPPIECEFFDIILFLKCFVADHDKIWMKLNCEGSECAILSRLLDHTSDTDSLHEVLVDFDARKIPSQAARVEVLENRLKNANFHCSYPEQVQYGMINNYGSIRNWLIVTGAREPGYVRRLKSFSYQIPFFMSASYNGYYKKRILDRHAIVRKIHSRLRRTRS